MQTEPPHYVELTHDGFVLRTGGWGVNTTMSAGIAAMMGFVALAQLVVFESFWMLLPVGLLGAMALLFAGLALRNVMRSELRVGPQEVVFRRTLAGWTREHRVPLDAMLLVDCHDYRAGDAIKRKLVVRRGMERFEVPLPDYASRHPALADAEARWCVQAIEAARSQTRSDPDGPAKLEEALTDLRRRGLRARGRETSR